jgi:hypothetical protein
LAICRDPALLDSGPPLEVDLRAYPAVGIDAQIERGHDVLGWAIKFGRVLFQREAFWTKIVKKWRHHVPLPSPKVARARTAAAYRRLAGVLKLGAEDAIHEQALCDLTHLARAELLERGVYPISRPELAEQLRVIGETQLARRSDRLLPGQSCELSEIGTLLEPAV